MTATLPAPTAPLLSRSQKLLLKRLGWAVLLAALLHTLFFGAAPYLKLVGAPLRPTEVVQISRADLARLKQQIAKNKILPALLEQELREKYKTKTPPRDPKFIGRFNQSVPEETIAGPQSGAPQLSGGGGDGQNPAAESTRSSRRTPSQPLRLSDLGPGYKLPKPMPSRDSALPGTQGPPQHFRPVGREDKRMKHGPDNLLNAAESEYYSFFSRFEEPIIRNWYFIMPQIINQLYAEMARSGVPAGTDIPCTVRFTIDRTGRFISIDVVESSGFAIFDDATKAAVAKLDSLHNPPPGLFKGESTFSYHLSFAVEAPGQAPLSAPQLQWY